MAKRKSLKANQVRRPIEYYPPSREVIDAYANAVCQELGKVDATYNTPDTIREFSAFMRIVGKIYSKHLNRQNAQ